MTLPLDEGAIVCGDDIERQLGVHLQPQKGFHRGPLWACLSTPDRGVIWASDYRFVLPEVHREINQLIAESHE